MSKSLYPMPENIPALPEVAIDWLDFYNEDADKVWKIHLNWIASNWECLFGNGCPGCISREQNVTLPAVGCCVNGVYFESDEDFKNMEKSVSLLTEKDLDKDQLDWIAKNGWYNQYSKEGQPFSGKTKVKDGGCVLARRGQGEEGKTGCAMHHLGQRIGKSHTELMPKTCWQLPIGHREDVTDSLGKTYDLIIPWDKDYFDMEDGEPEDDATMLYWCVNTPDAYCATNPIYVSMREELIAVMGESSYNQMVELITERRENMIGRMPGAVRNEGRPMLPILIGDRPAKASKFNK